METKSAAFPRRKFYRSGMVGKACGWRQPAIDNHGRPDDHYVLNRPCLVVPSKQGIGLMQALFTVDPESRVQLNRSSIIMQAITVDAMKSHYAQTTSGIIT